MKQVHEKSAGRLIKEAREGKGLTQAKLAEQIGVQPREISRWENDEAFPRSIYHEALSKILGKTLEELGLVSQIPSTQPPHSPTNVTPTYQTFNQTKLIGRHDDITEIFRLLLEEGVQFLTLSGSPGVGKSELARQIEKIAIERKLFTSVHFISLEGVTNIPEITKEIRKYLPSDTQTKVLLILDNCEQIEDIGKAASEIYELLIQYSNFYILATSQAQFIGREHPVLPLSRPRTVYETLKELETYDAIELFRQSAKRAGDEGKYPLTKENAQKIAALCIGLDGLPLAILIAASCAKYRTIDDVYAWYESSELYDKPYKKDNTPRHENLNSLFEYSYSLLKEQQQKVLRRLAVFVGICHRSAAVNICNLGDLPADLDTILEELSDRHLIEYRDNYISMHHSLRKFAKGKLEPEAETELSQRYYHHYYTLIAKFGTTRWGELNNEEIEEINGFYKLGDRNGLIVANEILYIRLRYIRKELFEYFGQDDEFSFLMMLLLRERHGWAFYDNGAWLVKFLRGRLTEEEAEKINRISKAYRRIHKKLPYPRYHSLIFPLATDEQIAEADNQEPFFR